MDVVDVYVEICRENVSLPFYAREGDAGMDACAACETLIYPGETKIVPTGLKFAIPIGYEIQVRPRSGISLKTTLRIANSPGTIDSGFRDEVGIIVTNTSLPAEEVNINCGQSPEEAITLDASGNRRGAYLIRRGDRIAQFVLAEVPKMRLKQTADVGAIGLDRGGGFGSTGVNNDKTV